MNKLDSTRLATKIQPGEVLPMTQPSQTRILILTADAGFGHRRAANAIAQALDELYGDNVLVEVSNPMDDPRVMSALRNTQSDHDQFARGLRDIYEVVWQASRARVPSALLGSVLSATLHRVMSALLERFQPDVIVNTYPLYHPPLRSIFKAKRKRKPVVTVITDLGTVHRLWFYRPAAACLVATEKVRRQAISYGLKAEKVHISGIPIAPAFSKESRSKEALRHELGWRTDLPVALAVGSVRVLHMAEIVRGLNSAGLPLQLAVVAGGDAGLMNELQQIEWQMPVHIYDWVEELPVMMHAADFIISKAGGLIIAESLACGLPLLLVDVMPDQEKGNVQYVLQAEAGELGLSPGEAVNILRSWLAEDNKLLARRAHNARMIGRPQAAYTAAGYAWRCAGNEP
jgi:1,2-diacylglycerol 3-beta-galactosyltransferase